MRMRAAPPARVCSFTHPLCSRRQFADMTGLGMWQGPCNSFCLPLQHAEGMAAAGTSGKRLDVQERCRGREGLINAVSIFVVSTLNILHSFLRLHFVASCLLVQSPYQVLQCSTYYLRAAKDPKTCKTLRLSTHPFF